MAANTVAAPSFETLAALALRMRRIKTCLDLVLFSFL